jgi:hypothetical protein
MFIQIDDPKKRDRIVEDFLKTRKNIKQNFEQDKRLNIGFREETQKLFKPITESITEQKASQKENMTTMLDKMEDQKKFLARNQNVIFKKLNEVSAITSGSKLITVSDLIKNYLSDNNPKERSNAGYSIRFDTKTNQYTIGNQVIKFDNNFMEIAGHRYEATEGLMELLTKKSLDMDKIIEEDKEDYKRKLIDTNALYQTFDPNISKKLNSDSSEKWKFISTELFPNLVKKKGGTIGDKNTTFLPSDPNSLINQLKLSIASYTAGNNGEYNKINSILDELLKQKVITMNKHKKIIKNIFSK